MSVRQAISLLEHVAIETEAEYHRKLEVNPEVARMTRPRLTPSIQPRHRQLRNEEITALFQASFGCDGSMFTRAKVLIDIAYFQIFELMRGVVLECFLPDSHHSTIYIVPPGTARTRKFLDLQRKIFLEGLRLSGLGVSSPKTAPELRCVFREERT